jgi:hypothetical protein
MIQASLNPFLTLLNIARESQRIAFDSWQEFLRIPTKVRVYSAIRDRGIMSETDIMSEFFGGTEVRHYDAALRVLHPLIREEKIIRLKSDPTEGLPEVATHRDYCKTFYKPLD